MTVTMICSLQKKPKKLPNYGRMKLWQVVQSVHFNSIAEQTQSTIMQHKVTCMDTAQIVISVKKNMEIIRYLIELMESDNRIKKIFESWAKQQPINKKYAA